ncbi:hypothetical protein EMCRGX_G007814 [Ephydatia muelleri]
MSKGQKLSEALKIEVTAFYESDEIAEVWSAPIKAPCSGPTPVETRVKPATRYIFIYKSASSLNLQFRRKRSNTEQPRLILLGVRFDASFLQLIQLHGVQDCHLIETSIILQWHMPVSHYYTNE